MKYDKGYMKLTGVTAWLGRNVFYYRKAELNEVFRLIDGNKKILDLGCNTGYLTRLLKDTIPESKVFGADINAAAIKHAQNKHKDLMFFQIDDEFYKNHKFDYVVLSHILEHVKDPEQMLKNVGSILDKDGKLLLMIPQERIKGDTTVPQIVQNMLKFKIENPHIHKIDYPLCQRMLIDAGFSIDYAKYINLFFPFSTKKKMLHSWSLVILAGLKEGGK